MFYFEVIRAQDLSDIDLLGQAAEMDGKPYEKE